VVYTTGEWTK